MSRQLRIIFLWFGLLSLGLMGTALGATETDIELQRLQREVEIQKQKIQDLEEEVGQVRIEKQTQPVRRKAGQEKPELKIGGALRFNYVLTDFNDDNNDRGGDMVFDIFRINVDASYKNVLLSAEYRWYSYMNVIHHGWVGYKFSDTTQAQAGVTKVPFGILPFASHSYWFGETYYLGLEDDYDMGVKYVYDDTPWNLQLAFFKNGDWGDPTDLNRYSVDVVVADDQENEETNQVNARLAYKFKHGTFGSTELGASGMWGQLYNRTTEDSGDHWAAAAHLDGYYGGWNLMLEAVRYEYNPENQAGVSDATILLGSYGSTFLTAAKGTVYVANLAYKWDVDWGPVSDLTFYNDYSILVKDEDGFPDTQLNTAGCMLHIGPVYTYIDFIFGKNAVFLGAGDTAQAQSTADQDWNFRFNVNVGYYF